MEVNLYSNTLWLQGIPMCVSWYNRTKVGRGIDCICNVWLASSFGIPSSRQAFAPVADEHPITVLSNLLLQNICITCYAIVSF